MATVSSLKERQKVGKAPKPDRIHDPVAEVSPGENREPASTKTAEGEARLAFLIEHHQLPPFLRILETLPDGVRDEATPLAGQAEKEWPEVARNLSLPVGEWAGYFDGGVIYRIGNRFLQFDLEALWRHLSLY